MPLYRTSTRPASDVLGGPRISTNSATSVPGVSESISLSTTGGGGGAVSLSLMVSVNGPPLVAPVTLLKVNGMLSVASNVASSVVTMVTGVVAPAGAPTGKPNVPVTEVMSELLAAGNTIIPITGALSPAGAWSLAMPRTTVRFAVAPSVTVREVGLNSTNGLSTGSPPLPTTKAFGKAGFVASLPVQLLPFPIKPRSWPRVPDVGPV